MKVEEREKIVHKKQENPTWSQTKIAKSLGMSKSTVGYVLKHFNGTLTVNHSRGNGRKMVQWIKKITQKIIRSIT